MRSQSARSKSMPLAVKSAALLMSISTRPKVSSASATTRLQKSVSPWSPLRNLTLYPGIGPTFKWAAPLTPIPLGQHKQHVTVGRSDRMASARQPGPMCQALKAPRILDEGTLCRCESPRPGIVGALQLLGALMVHLYLQKPCLC